MNRLITLAAEHAALLKGLALGSLAFFIVTPIAVPVVIIRMPRDILVRRRRPLGSRTPLGRVAFILWHLLKNLAGIALILTGTALLFLPGQGLLTLFVGVMVADIPGKSVLLHRLLAAKGVRPAVDRFRMKYRKMPLVYPEVEGER